MVVMLRAGLPQLLKRLGSASGRGSCVRSSKAKHRTKVLGDWASESGRKMDGGAGPCRALLAVFVSDIIERFPAEGWYHEA